LDGEEEARMQQGGCLCGKVRWQVEGEVGPAGICHCGDCRRVTGSAFNVSVRVPSARFRVTQGSPRAYTKAADSGRPIRRHFCADCGAPLWTDPPQHPDLVFIKAGSFDDPTLVRPVQQAWLDSAVSWRDIPADLPGYRKGRT
jgi:hypothetical protein